MLLAVVSDVRLVLVRIAEQLYRLRRAKTAPQQEQHALAMPASSAMSLDSSLALLNKPYSLITNIGSQVSQLDTLSYAMSKCPRRCYGPMGHGPNSARMITVLCTRHTTETPPNGHI